MLHHRNIIYETNYFKDSIQRLQCGGRVEESQPSVWSCSVIWWYSSRYLCAFCSRANKLRQVCMLFYVILLALCRHLTSHISLMLKRWVPSMCWPVLTTRLGTFRLSWVLTCRSPSCVRLFWMQSWRQKTAFWCRWCVKTEWRQTKWIFWFWNWKKVGNDISLLISTCL